MNGLSLLQAGTIVDKALEHGKTLGLPPLTIAVLDGAGCLVALKREDGSSLLRPDIAQAKAFGTLAMGMGSRAIAQRASVAPAFVSAVTALAGGRIIPVPGGVLIRSDKLIIGAVGITGAKSEQDEACAVVGITAAGFTADTGEEPAS
ncbi:MAG: heme-binding protein [Pseudomonadota bacterium]|nr:heme-binding protein [Pseudomonadota bacterium]